MGFLVIIITLALAPTIYTSNAAVLSYSDTVTGLTDADFVGLTAVAGFGAFIIIFGLLTSGGIFAVAGVQGKLANTSVADMLKVIGSVIVIILMLALFTSLLDYVAALVDAADTASDTIGETGFGIIPIVIYVGILASAGWAQVSAYRKARGGGRSRRGSRIAYA